MNFVRTPFLQNTSWRLLLLFVYSHYDIYDVLLAPVAPMNNMQLSSPSGIMKSSCTEKFGIISLIICDEEFVFT